MEGNRNCRLSYRPASESDLDEIFALVKAAIATAIATPVARFLK